MSASKTDLLFGVKYPKTEFFGDPSGPDKFPFVPLFCNNLDTISAILALPLLLKFIPRLYSHVLALDTEVKALGLNIFLQS